MKENCPFCEKNIRNDGTKTWDKGLFWIKENMSPYKGNEGIHFMLIPKRHIKFLTEMNEQESEEFMGLIKVVTERMLFETGKLMFLLRQNTDGQSQEHLHLHFMVNDSTWMGVIPRGEYITTKIQRL